MLQRNPWLLPDGFEEILPDDAKQLEQLRNRILSIFSSWGYDLVIPPFIDYLQSLLTGAGHDLDLQTFKLTDQLSGELLGVRADMTPQVARIDAHHHNNQCPNRLCYAGTVLHSVGDSLDKTRSPMQIGAELYGHTGIESDIEVIQLMLEMLSIAGLKAVHLDLGQVSIFRDLAKQAKLNSQQESDLFDVLQRKAVPELMEKLDSYKFDQKLKKMFLLLPELNGDVSVLTKAKENLSAAGDKVLNSLADLKNITEKLAVIYPSLPISVDLAELRGYYYHTGVVFSAFVPEVGKEVARGGRYDNIGASFGRARAATGFSSDLKVLTALTKHQVSHENIDKIFAPDIDDHELAEFVRDLRSQGNIVIQALKQQSGNAKHMGCTKIIIKTDQGWAVSSVTE